MHQLGKVSERRPVGAGVQERSSQVGLTDSSAPGELWRESSSGSFQQSLAASSRPFSTESDQ